MTDDNRERLLLVDGNSLLHRAYHGYPSLSTKEGEVIGAVYGFSTMLLTAIEKLTPEYVAVAWDVSKETFRHKDFAEYKAGRPEMDEELAGQIERTKEVVSVLNIPQFGLNGYEADDLIGTLSKQAITSRKKTQVVILTGDRDALQLIEDNRIVVYMPAGGASKYVKDRGISIYDEVAVKAKYGLSPKQIIDLKGLMGDPSDNIKGVKGIGQVTATKLLMEEGSVENIYKNLNNLKTTERVKQLLRDDEKSAYLSKKLATIDREVPIEMNWEACQLSDYDRDKVLALFEALGFKSLINRLPKDSWEKDLGEVFG